MKKLASLFLAAALIAPASLAAAEYPAMNVRLSHNQPVGSPEDVGAQTFKKLMEEKSGGRITHVSICLPSVVFTQRFCTSPILMLS